MVRGEVPHCCCGSVAAAGRPGSGGIPPGSGGIPTRVGWYLWGQPSFCLVRRFWVGGGGQSPLQWHLCMYNGIDPLNKNTERDQGQLLLDGRKSITL